MVLILVDQLLGAINLCSNDLVLHSTLHHQVNVILKDLAKRLARIQVGVEALGDLHRAKLNQQINIAFPWFEVVP